MKKLFLTFLTLLANIGVNFANGTKIGDLSYNLNSFNRTAEVTYRVHNSSVMAINIDLNEYNKGWMIESAIIPETVEYKGITYTVTSIGEKAFKDCKVLKSVVIPNSVTSISTDAFLGCNNLPIIDNIRYADTYLVRVEDKTLPQYTIREGTRWIGGYSFQNCKNLTNIIIPESVISIGEGAFCGCSSLISIVIPNSVKTIKNMAFSYCPELIIYSSNTTVPDFPTDRLKWMSPANLLYYYPFSVFAKAYVEKGVNEWQKKGEFERTTDWQQRVNEQTRQQQIQSLLTEAEKDYISYHANNITINPSLGKYDADNEVFAMNDEQFGGMYMPVLLDEAKDFKANWNRKTITPQMQILNDQVKLAGLTITMPNGKKYTYRNTDAVNYNLAEVEYNFEPIELDIPQHTAAPQGERNITTTKVQMGISKVDKDIPSTNASNPNTFVIIFANEDYKNVASVPFAKNDGTTFQKYCQKTLGIPASNIHYVENASFNDIRIQLAWLKDVCDAFEGNASVIVYYAGHGIPDEATKSAYLLPVDGDGRYVQSAYKIDEFYQKLGAMKAQSVTVFMDACFSGSKREEGMLASARGVALKVKSGEPQGNMVVFSAAQGDETAYPNNDEQHGMFTYYLLKKLQETKGDVTLQDLGSYITTNVRQQSIVKNGKSQTPCVIPSASLGTEWQSWKLK